MQPLKPFKPENNMTLQQLEYILAVDELKHFAKAAEHCKVTQPALSAAIQKLEDELNAKLFDRTTQPVQPTLIGRKVIEQAKIALREAELIKDIVKEEIRSVSGVFRLGVLSTIAPYLLPRFLPELTEEYPALDIRITEMKSHDCLNALKNGELEAVLVAEMVEGDHFHSTPLYYESFLGYVSKYSPLFKKETIRPIDINEEQLWLPDEGLCFRDQLTRFCQLKPETFGLTAYRQGSLETFMHMVESGKGITFIPELAALQLSEERKRLIRPFVMPRPVRKIYLVTRTDFIRHSLLNILTEKIKACVPKEMLSLQNGQKIV